MSGAGVGALLGAGLMGTAHADGPLGLGGSACGIDVGVIGVISVTTPGCTPAPGTPATAPAQAAAAVPQLPIVADLPVAPVDVPQVTLPSLPVLGGGSAGPTITVPPVLVPVVAPVLGPVTSLLPIPVATVVVDTPIATCTVDAAAVAVGATCGVDVRAATGLLPPVAAATVDAVIDDLSGVVDPALADLHTVTGASATVGPQTEAIIDTCTGIALLTPAPQACATAVTTPGGPATTLPGTTTPGTTIPGATTVPPAPGGPTAPTTPGADPSGTTIAGGNGNGMGADSNGGTTTVVARGDLIGTGRGAGIAAADDGDGSSLPSTGVAIGGAIGLGTVILGAGIGARALATRRKMTTLP